MLSNHKVDMGPINTRTLYNTFTAGYIGLAMKNLWVVKISHRDIHCDIIMGHDFVMAHITMLQCILMLLGPSFIMYYYAQL